MSGPVASRAFGKRIVEALLFAAEAPLDAATIQAHLPGGLHAADLLDELIDDYAPRGVRLERRGNRFAFRTAPDVAPHLAREQVQSRRLSRAAIETLAIIAYHQPVTRAELEEMRGVAVSKGTLDLLLATGWVQPKGRREVPGRPVTWITTQAFLDQFDLAVLDDLPPIEELLQVGLLSPLGTDPDQTDPDRPGPESADAPADRALTGPQPTDRDPFSVDLAATGPPDPERADPEGAHPGGDGRKDGGLDPADGR